MNNNKEQVKALLLTVALSILSSPTHALPLAPGYIHHPIHYKPSTSHLLPSGLSPKQVRTAYGFNAIAAQGKGQTIAIVDAYDDPRIEADLAVFNKEFGLPACTTANTCFKKIYAKNKKPKTDAGWAGEIALDVEWAHAMAPQAKIILVEAASDSIDDLFQAVAVATHSGANVVSMSWGAAEFSEQTLYDELFANPRITFTASSGDSGTGTIYPASSPNVLAVGGTTLEVDTYGNYQGETAWSGSGGGVSTVETWPVYQSTLPIPQANNMRGIPDVAYNADPETGFSVYSSVPGDGGIGWQVVGGTSAGAPQWAALIALANCSLPTNLGNTVNHQLYTAANPTAGQYTTYFNDITNGSNGDCGFHCSAQDGYDYLTGLGSPEVANLINAFTPVVDAEPLH